MTHPGVWRSDGGSPRPVDSYSLQETRTKRRQTCECGVVRKDCICPSYPPHRLDTHDETICNWMWCSRKSPKKWLHASVAFKDRKEFDTHLSDAGEARSVANTSSCTPGNTHTDVVHYKSRPHLHQHHTLMAKHAQLSKIKSVLPPWPQTQQIHRIKKKKKHNLKSVNPKMCTFTLPSQGMMMLCDGLCQT